MILLRTIILLSGLLATALNANPFTDAVDKAQPNAEELKQAQQQLEKLLPEEIIEPLFVAAFHQNTAKTVMPKTLCLSCHNDAAHRNSPRKRAFLNMHSRIISCKTCHWQPEEIALNYRWHKIKGTKNIKGLITPWLNDNPVITMEDDPWAHKLKQDWETANNAEKVKIKAQLHQPLQQQGRSCGACHQSEDNLLNLQKLDYKPGRIRALELNSTARFIERTEPKTADEPIQRLHLRDLLE